MYEVLKPYASMLFWFAIGLTVSILFLKSLILSTGTDDASQAIDKARSQAPNLTVTTLIRKRSPRGS
jgi:hypothetical protein